MKKALLLSSLAINLALAALTLSRPAFAADAASPAQAAPTGLWATLYSEDIPTYAANLRLAGGPEATIGVLIGEAINLRFAEREKALQPSILSLQSLREEFTPERREALLQLRIEKNALFRAVFGHSIQLAGSFNWTAGGLARLTVAERDTVSMIMGDYDTMISRVLVQSQGHLMDDDREKLRFLESQRDVDLGKLLSPDEILDFNLIATAYGRTVRNYLSYFEPTTEQLRTYLALGKKHGLDYDGGGANLTRHNEEQVALHADLAKIWDAPTYEKYRRTTSGHYVYLTMLVRRLQLPLSTAEDIFASQKTATERSYELYAKARMNPPSLQDPRPGIEQVVWPAVYPANDIRTAAINDIIKITADHCDFVRSKLGDAGFKEYYELNSRWLEVMQAGGVARLDYSLP
ncbi:MAG TPA: hypothetical protein VG838_04525 [Opitutaceae bacterium]|nr:hypothetical protein [Opitutaceae bacterium]